MKVKKYDSYKNHLIFEGLKDFFKFGDKKSKNIEKTDSSEEIELPKPKKNAKESDQDMIELISDIKNNFDIKNLSIHHNDSDLVTYQDSTRSASLTYEYKLNEIPIKINYRYGAWRLEINYQGVSMILVSSYLLKDLLDFFINEEIQQKINNNTNIFNKAIISRREAEKYNL